MLLRGSGRMLLWFVLLFLGTLTIAVCMLALGAEAAPLTQPMPVPVPVSVPAGASIYAQGILPSGALLRGERAQAGSVQGQAAACITCHRVSGLGSAEGRVAVPPITGKFLFQPHATNIVDVRLPNPSGVRVTRPAYTADSFARALREGIAPDGRRLSVLMPRYALDDAALQALLQYLSGLGAAPAPGVEPDSLHFATIITPDTAPAQRTAMLEVMEHFFADKNAFVRGGQRPMVSARGVEYRVVRRWQLHVWSLQGAPDAWESQLRALQQAQPVLAVVSGLGGAQWGPVHRFCQQAHVPCLFPNVDLPLEAEQDFYPVYFSRGVLLEAALMQEPVQQWLQQPKSAASAARLVQLYRSGTGGEAAARALQRTLGGTHGAVRMVLRPLEPQTTNPSQRSAALAQALRDVQAQDFLVLWLDNEDLALLPERVPTEQVLVSGLLAGLERTRLPAAWRQAARMTYPVDLPQERKVRMNFPLAWMRIHQLPVVDERLQTDTYVACGILAETLTELQANLEPDYLLERLESMLSHRQVNGYYPRLSLGPGQRFASKGGYLVRWDDSSGGQGVVAEGDWRVP